MTPPALDGGDGRALRCERAKGLPTAAECGEDAIAVLEAAKTVAAVVDGALRTQGDARINAAAPGMGGDAALVACAGLARSASRSAGGGCRNCSSVVPNHFHVSLVSRPETVLARTAFSRFGRSQRRSGTDEKARLPPGVGLLLSDASVAGGNALFVFMPKSLNSRFNN
jgi:hypothetical protein